MDRQYTLQYVEVIHRHHKRTPYASNLFPAGEDLTWDCGQEYPICEEVHGYLIAMAADLER